MTNVSESQTDDQNAYCMHGQNIQLSQFYAARYVDEHKLPVDELTTEQSMGLATARVQWLLEHTRPQLSGKFTKEDITTLMDCYHRYFFFPDQCNLIAAQLRVSQGIDVHGGNTSRPGKLEIKLNKLNSIQRLTLSDALEQAWHRGRSIGKSASEFLPTLGIRLAL